MMSVVMLVNSRIQICTLLLVVLVSQQPTFQIRVPPNTGICSVETWKKAWPGCQYEDGVTEGHLSVVGTSNGNAFRVDYALGQIGPERGGVGWRYPVAKSNTVELNYTVEFSSGFDWVKGGKLPGLCGGPKSVTGGKPANGMNGFSARLMWRADGRGEAYVYHMNQPKKYGHSFPFPARFRFPTAEPVKVRLRVSMNTPGRRDGKLDVWLQTRHSKKYQHVVSRADMEWRAVADFGVDSVLFETFHGGGDKNWAPRKPSFALFNRISVRSVESR